MIQKEKHNLGPHTEDGAFAVEISDSEDTVLCFPELLKITEEKEFSL